MADFTVCFGRICLGMTAVLLRSLTLVALPNRQPTCLGSGVSCPSANKPLWVEQAPLAEEGAETRASGPELPSLHTGPLEGGARWYRPTGGSC